MDVVSEAKPRRPGGFQKGRPKTGGRKPGVQNVVNRSVKDAILKAFDKAGGADYLARQAEENPQAFLTLLGRVLPMTLAGGEGTSGKLVIRWES